MSSVAQIHQQHQQESTAASRFLAAFYKPSHRHGDADIPNVSALLSEHDILAIVHGAKSLFMAEETLMNVTGTEGRGGEGAGVRTVLAAALGGGSCMCMQGVHARRGGSHRSSAWIPTQGRAAHIGASASSTCQSTLAAWHGS